MARGGYRPGAGRKFGSKDKKKQRAISPEAEEKKKIRELLAFDKKAKAKFYQEFLSRIGKGEILSVSEKKLMSKIASELAEAIDDKDKDESKLQELDPLTYMLKVMNDPNAGEERRDRMAIAAAAYVHGKPLEPKGKKRDREDKAKEAAAGRFASGSPPLKLVK